MNSMTMKSHGKFLMVLAGALGLITAEVISPVWGGAGQTSPFLRPVIDFSIASYVATPGLSGRITIVGSDTMLPLVTRVASAFRQWQPDIKVTVQGGGSDAALRIFLQGIAGSRRGDGNVRGHLGASEVAIVASSRAMTTDERKEFRSRFGYEPTEIPLALDAVAIYVHRDNPLPGLTMEQVDAIFSKDRKRGVAEAVTTWGQVGLQNGWEQKPIRLYGQDKRSGTRGFFIRQALLDGALKPEVKEEPGPASVILSLSHDVTGIGYASIGFQASTVRVLPLAEKAGMSFILPSAETTADGSYPLSRFLYFYVNHAPNDDLKPEVLEFLKFCNAREGQAAVAKVGMYPLPAAIVAQNQQMLLGHRLSASVPGRL